MWTELLTALGLVMVIEGILPFLTPSKVRRVWLHLSQTEDHVLRAIGLISMLIGVAMIYFLR